MSPRELRAEVDSDGTLDGTGVRLNGVELQNVASVDVHIDARGASLQVRVGESGAVTDLGPPDAVHVENARPSLAPAPTPPPPR